MPLVRLTKAVGCYSVGEVAAFPSHEADRLVTKGAAEHVEPFEPASDSKSEAKASTKGRKAPPRYVTKPA